MPRSPSPTTPRDLRSIHPALAALLLAPAASAAQGAGIEQRNVVLTRPGAPPLRLTTGGRDRDPALSPGGRRVAFVRGDPVRSELRIVDVGGGPPRRLVAPAAGRRAACEPHSLRFAAVLAGRTVYFLAEACATSGAVHAVELATGRVRYVCPGNSQEVVPRGEYAGHLVVQQHRYFVDGGAYDWYWLVTPKGEDVGPLGEATELFRESRVAP